VAFIMGALVRGGVDPGAAAVAARTAHLTPGVFRVVLDGALEVVGLIPAHLTP
jgi:hypothetical protein